MNAELAGILDAAEADGVRNLEERTRQSPWSIVCLVELLLTSSGACLLSL